MKAGTAELVKRGLLAAGYVGRVRKDGLPGQDIEGFGQYRRNLINWINGKGVTL